MNKKKSIPLLKTKYTKLGLTEASLGALAAMDTLVELADDASEDEIQTAISGVEPFAKMLQKAEDGARTGLLDKQKADAADKGKDKDKGGDSEPETPTGGTENPEIKALTDLVKSLTATVSEMKGENTAKSRKALFAKELEGLSDTFKKEQLEDFDMFNFKDDEHFTTWLDARKERYEGIRQEQTTERAGQFGQNQRAAGGGSTTEKPSNSMKQFLETKKGGSTIVGKDLFSEQQ